MTQIEALKNILENPKETLVIHDVDGVLGNDTIEDVFQSILKLHKSQYWGLDFWRDFLEPFYIARHEGMRIVNDEKAKKAVISDSGVIPWIGNELIPLHNLLIESVDRETLLGIIESAVGGCLISPQIEEHFQKLGSFFDLEKVYVVSGSFKELVMPVLTYAGFDEEKIYATEMCVAGENGEVGCLKRVIASGEGKTNITQAIMAERGLKNLLVIDDGTTGIDVVNYCYGLRQQGYNAVAIAYNPSRAMMQNAMSAIYFRTAELLGLLRFLEKGEVAECGEFITSEGSCAIEVLPETDIGLIRASNVPTPYGFRHSKDDPVSEGSIAEACLNARAGYKNHLVRFDSLRN